MVKRVKHQIGVRNRSLKLLKKGQMYSKKMKKIGRRHREPTAAELHGGEIVVSSKIDVHLPRVR